MPRPPRVVIALYDLYPGRALLRGDSRRVNAHWMSRAGLARLMRLLPRYYNRAGRRAPKPPPELTGDAASRAWADYWCPRNAILILAESAVLTAVNRLIPPPTLPNTLLRVDSGDVSYFFRSTKGENPYYPEWSYMDFPTRGGAQRINLDVKE